MRRVRTLVPMIVLGLAAVACGGDSTPGAGGTTSPGGTSSQPTASGSPTNNEGQLDATSMAGFSLELDDNYFKPTFIKGKTGQALNIELENEGAAAHTFTITGLIDKEVPAGGKVEIDITLPSSTSDVAFFCRFHGTLGMRGAFFFGAAPSAEAGAAEPDPY